MTIYYLFRYVFLFDYSNKRGDFSLKMTC